MTPDEVRAFQRREMVVDGELGPPTDWLGTPLRVDGDLGPRTRWAIAISKLAAWRQAVVKRACSKIGERETVANRGAWPDFVLRRCGIYVPEDPEEPSPDHAWCAAHASWCASVDGLPVRREAGARKLAASMRWPGPVVLPGDFGWFPTGQWQAHIFPIIGVGPGEVAAAEGNHGNGVELVRRELLHVNVVTPGPAGGAPPSPAAVREQMALIPPGLTLVPVRAAGTR